MIKINLLGEDIQRDSSVLLWAGGIVVSFVAFFMVTAFLYFDVSNQLTIRKQEVSDLERQLAQLKVKTAEVDGLESKRSELNNKLAIIAELKFSKYGPVRVLDDLNESIPERSWLQSAVEKGNKLEIVGYALDGQTVADFMNRLKESDYFGDSTVETRSTNYEGVKIQSFMLSTQLSYSGSLKEPTGDTLGSKEVIKPEAGKSEK